MAGKKFCVGNNGGIRYLSHQAVRDERRRMSMKNSLDIRTFLIDRQMKGIFHRRSVDTDDGTVGFDLHDIFAAKIAFINATGTDPNGTLGVPNGKVSARCRRHIMVIDTIHQHHDLIRRMKHFEIHKQSLLYIESSISARSAETKKRTENVRKHFGEKNGAFFRFFHLVLRFVSCANLIKACSYAP